MRVISRGDFEEAFRNALTQAGFQLREDILAYLNDLKKSSQDDSQKKMIDIYLDNARIACEESRGICQDTGYVQVYIKQGYSVSFDFNPETLINSIVAEVYESNQLRKSMAHPLTRENTGNNTPAFVNIEYANDETLELTIMLKGGGSENVTRSGLLLPTTNEESIVDWVTQAVSNAGAKACPPYLIGVGIGGSLEKALSISKRQLLWSLDEDGMDERERRLSVEIMRRLNDLPIGFQGLKFGDTAMAVKLKTLPCHIATLPIAVSIGCNVVRQASIII